MQENAKIREIKGIQHLMCSQTGEIQKLQILKMNWIRKNVRKLFEDTRNE